VTTSHLLFPLFLLQGFHVSAQETQPPPQDQQQPPTSPYQISVSVDLVVIHATVSTRKGAPVAGLQEQDFEIYEDGVRQKIRLFRREDIPVTVGLVVDHSGSMKPKLADVTAAARAFVTLSNPEDQMFVVNFNEFATAMPFAKGVEELESAIANAPVAGQTALYDATLAAFTQLRAGNRDKRALIIISDGGDNASKGALADVLKEAEKPDVLVYTIGIFEPENQDRNSGVLRQLAQSTGGAAFFPDQRREIIAVC
jgi:VWFA-related protein